jgi:hypothetical protein
MRLVAPTGKELVTVILLGIIGGFVLDYALKGVEFSLKSTEERALDVLVEQEKEKIVVGQIRDQIPSKVIWVKPQAV